MEKIGRDRQIKAKLKKRDNDRYRKRQAGQAETQTDRRIDSRVGRQTV